MGGVIYLNHNVLQKHKLVFCSFVGALTLVTQSEFIELTSVINTDINSIKAVNCVNLQGSCDNKLKIVTTILRIDTLQ